MCYPAQATNNVENPTVVVEDVVVQNQPEPQDVVVDGVVVQNQHQIQDVAEEGVVFRLIRALKVRRITIIIIIRLRKIINFFDSDDETDYDWSNFISVRGFNIIMIMTF